MTQTAVRTLPRIVAASAVGADHLRVGKKCEDAFTAARRGNFVALAVADGMGSAPRGGEGARLACDSAINFLLAPENEHCEPLDCVNAVRAALDDRASNGHCLQDFACTLMVAYGTLERMTLAHIGDGAIVGITGGEPVVLSQPARSEYLNETDSLTSTDFGDRVRQASTCRTMDAIVVLTDGCQHAAFTRLGDSYRAHGGFFNPLVDYFRNRPARTSHDLAELLSGAKLGEHSGDDKTVAMVLWS